MAAVLAADERISFSSDHEEDLSILLQHGFCVADDFRRKRQLALFLCLESNYFHTGTILFALQRQFVQSYIFPSAGIEDRFERRTDRRKEHAFILDKPSH